MRLFLTIFAALLATAVVVGVVHQHRGGSRSLEDVASMAGALACDRSDYQVVSQFSGKESVIYDCTIGSRERCVTVDGGIAHDSTATVRLLFADTLGSVKPGCLDLG